MDCIVIFRATQSLDDILPLVFEFRKNNMIPPPIFVAWDKEKYDFIIKNPVLIDGIKAIGGKLTYLYKFKNKQLNIFYNAFTLKKYFLGKVLSIEYEIGSKFVSTLAFLNKKLWKGKRIKSLIFNMPFRQAKNLNRYMKLFRKDTKVAGQLNIDGYDALLLTQSKEQYENIFNVSLKGDCQIIEVGYTRGLKEWQRFLNEKASEYISKDIKSPYLFFILAQTGNSPQFAGEDCPPAGELLREALQILKEFNNDIMTVFKPHFYSEVHDLNAFLASIGFKNYIISYAHPQMLMKNAKFTFTYRFSSLSIQANFNRKITVEYAHYDSRFRALNGDQSVYYGCIDYFIHHNKEQLRKVFEELIRGNIEAKRDPIELREDFPMRSFQSLKAAFDKVLLIV